MRNVVRWVCILVHYRLDENFDVTEFRLVYCRVAVLDKVTDFLLFLGKLLIAGSVGECWWITISLMFIFSIRCIIWACSNWPQGGVRVSKHTLNIAAVFWALWLSCPSFVLQVSLHFCSLHAKYPSSKTKFQCWITTACLSWWEITLYLCYNLVFFLLTRVACSDGILTGCSFVPWQTVIFGSYLIAHSFFSIYAMCVDTLFLCFCKYFNLQ